MNANDLGAMWLQSTVLFGVVFLLALSGRNHPRAVQLITRTSLAIFVLLLAIPYFQSIPKPAPAISVELTQPIFSARSAYPNLPPAVESAIFYGQIIDWGGLLFYVWLAGSAAFAIHIALGLAVLGDIKKRSKLIANESLPSNIQLRESSEVETPFVAGLFKPAIFVPTGWSADTDIACQKAVIEHELGHVAAGDLRWIALYRLATVALWPVPFVWMIRRPMQLASEQICDAYVVSNGTAETDYADYLLSLRRPDRRLLPLAIGMAERNSSFGERIKSLLQGRPIRRLSAWTRTGVLAAVFVVGVAAFVTIGAKPHRQATKQSDGLLRPDNVKVNVVDSDGAPVKDAKAWITITGDLITETIDIPVVDAAVAVNVRKYIPDGPWKNYKAVRLYVYKPGLAIGLLTIWPTKTVNSTVELGLPTTMVSSITVPGSAKASGLKVFPKILQLPDQKQRFYMLDGSRGPTGITGKNGAFTIPDLPRGSDVQVEVDSDELAYVQNGHGVKMSNGGKSVAPPTIAELGGNFVGRVLEDGVGVPGIKVGAQGTDYMGWGDAITDNAGFYRIARLKAGTYIVATSLPLDAPYNSVALERVGVKAGQSSKLADIKLEPGSVVEGTVTNVDGSLSPFALVGCYGPAHPKTGAWVQNAITDAKGHFTMRVPAGEQYVYLMDEEQNQTSKTVTTTDGGSIRVDLRRQETKEVSRDVRP